MIFCKDCKHWSDFHFGRNQAGCYHPKGIDKIIYNHEGVDLQSYHGAEKLNKNNDCKYFKKGKNVFLTQKKARQIMALCDKNVPRKKDRLAFITYLGVKV